MNLPEAKVKELESWLLENELMDEGDYLEDTVRGDYYPIYIDQVRGHYYFTNQRIVFFSGILGSSNFSIKYSDIKAIKKSFIGPLLPFGVTITAFNAEKGKDKKYKLSLSSRKKWLELFSKKSGVTYQ
ncbi:MAG: hypothetical protein HDT39_12060 [Lachnospiraceae bacterium]|nr:hypothetical protein [Lachnospiraceae bacterium]